MGPHVGARVVWFEGRIQWFGIYGRLHGDLWGGRCAKSDLHSMCTSARRPARVRSMHGRELWPREDKGTLLSDMDTLSCPPTSRANPTVHCRHHRHAFASPALPRTRRQWSTSAHFPRENPDPFTTACSSPVSYFRARPGPGLEPTLAPQPRLHSSAKTVTSLEFISIQVLRKAMCILPVSGYSCSLSFL
jgi:hypothetical protein